MIGRDRDPWQPDEAEGWWDVLEPWVIVFLCLAVVGVGLGVVMTLAIGVMRLAAWAVGG